MLRGRAVRNEPVVVVAAVTLFAADAAALGDLDFIPVRLGPGAVDAARGSAFAFAFGLPIGGSGLRERAWETRPRLAMAFARAKRAISPGGMKAGIPGGRGAKRVTIAPATRMRGSGGRSLEVPPAKLACRLHHWVAQWGFYFVALHNMG